MPALLTPSGAAAAQFARLDGIVTLVDAKHIEQHLDEEKPEGAENEAVEQVAFADRLLLNKCDLASGEEELQRVEARLRAINAFAPIQRCEQAEVDVSSVLGIRGFSLERTLAMDPGTPSSLAQPAGPRPPPPLYTLSSRAALHLAPLAPAPPAPRRPVSLLPLGTAQTF